MARLPVKLVPRAARDEIVEWRAGRLRVRVTAAPERGRANAALEVLLAEALDIPRRRVRVVSGHTAPTKLVEIEGIDGENLTHAFEKYRG
jgi:uncharacterized protein YggU (UPF0235/DUF167 family)